MATDNNSESFTAEQLSVIADYEKTGPENVQEHYDMLLDLGLFLSFYIQFKGTRCLGSVELVFEKRL